MDETYGEEIHAYLKNLETQHSTADYLARHDVSEAYRAKMIDWMVEVLSAFQCSDETFFMACNVMDRYFKNASGKVQAKDLHLTGVTSMFVASKYHDILPLLMRTMVNKIGHKKFSSEQIIDREMEILLALGFKLGAPTHHEFLK